MTCFAFMEANRIGNEGGVPLFNAVNAIKTISKFHVLLMMKVVNFIVKDLDSAAAILPMV
jgi:hypothetical protein